ncbi:F-box domain-containing protein [Xylariales sp. AK1849]|nr:F-box domain-containing protein [Xylariales sp. AK1849]
MPLKRKRIDPEIDDTRASTIKKPRLGAASRDILSPLSDELLIRVLTLLPLSNLLNVAPVSKRFHQLCDDSQLWKRLYYSRFVLPRALRIPGFRDGSAREGKLHYSSRKAVWADGRRGGWVGMRSDDGDKTPRGWKRQYKLRHNWSRGKCAVEELRVREAIAVESSSSRKLLVKVCEGVAVTADATSGLRAWDLKTKQLVAHIGLSDMTSDAQPSCLATDDQNIQRETLDIAVGFTDGSFGVWRLGLRDHRLVRRYRHEKSTAGALVSTAFSYPYLLAATESVLVSLYTFDGPVAPKENETENETENEIASETEQGSESETARESESHTEASILPPPYLLTSLKSHTSRAPLALSIRKSAGTTIASIAYTFSTLGGWSLGIQDLHLRPSFLNSKTTPDITTTRLAYTIPFGTKTSQVPSPPPSPARAIAASPSDVGPTNICYTHPYLLATLPDNTLILYLCNSNASSLSISPGIRLWGHTSGISDAEITARGKAVSVSCRGEEIRVWELEGRADGRSIEVRPTASSEPAPPGQSQPDDIVAFDEKRNWVGFDDEMVIVLKESRGRESLMVYDFT